jgi:hypothetical protein
MNASGSKLIRSSIAIAIALLFGTVGWGAQFAIAQDDSPGGIDADAVSPDRLPLPINIQGGWSGSITDDSLGVGTFDISIVQKSRKLKGQWTAQLPDEPLFLGDFKGRATARVITLHIGSTTAFNKKSCQLNFHSLVASGIGISGKYTWEGCAGQFKGAGGTIDIVPNAGPG